MNPAFDPGALIGRPYERGADGPARFDCWGLYRWCAREGWGIHVPAISPAASLLGRTRQHKRERQSGRWETVAGELAAARGGDLVVLLPVSGRELHCGVWLDVDGGGVLHASEGPGVAFHRARALGVLWRVEEVVRYARE